MKRFFKLFLLLIPAFAFPLVIPPVPPPDSSQIRSLYIGEWIMQPIAKLRAMQPEIYTDNFGNDFQFRFEEDENQFYILVIPGTMLETDVYAADGMETILSGTFSPSAPGTWVLARDKLTSDPAAITYYFAGDSEVNITFHLSGGKTFADFVVFKQYAGRNVPVPVQFERLYTASFDEIRNWTKTFPWWLTDINAGMFNGTLQMIETIRDNLHRIVSVPDGVYDENGTLVSLFTAQPIKTDGELKLSGAGFLKWIIDGLVSPLTGSRMPISSVSGPTISYPVGSFYGVLSTRYNLTFALDWTRNLAVAATSTVHKRELKVSEAGTDVTSELFTVNSGFSYVPNTGYRTEALLPLLYMLSAIENNTFFLAAIQEIDRKPEQTEIHYFNNCAAIFPYFDSYGRFDAVVFENGAEYTLPEFIEKYRGNFVHLSRVQASDYFFPD
jgi:hypothetical protein